MTEDAETAAGMSPDEAFAILANETRLGILRTLGDADGPLSFSELFERVDYDTTANFSYHLDRLDGHFVRHADDGYDLRQAGRRIVEAVLSGAVTADPVVERTEIGMACFLCGGTMELQYRQEHVGLYCADCGGTRGGTSATAGWATDRPDDIVGYVALPPAGAHGRTPTELLHAAEIWTVAEAQASARGVCPRCSASVDHAVRACENHDGNGRCDRCDQEFGVTIHVQCTNCILEQEAVFTKHLLAHPELMAFMIDHGVDPVAPDGFHITALDETIVSTDPLEALFTFTADGDALTLTVGDDLSVVDATRHDASESV